MSQTIVQQVLDYMTDKTTSMAVKISHQADEIKALNKEITRIQTERRNERQEHEQDFEVQRSELRRLREQLESYEGRVPAEFSPGHLANLESMLHQARQERDQAEGRLEKAEQLAESVAALVYDRESGYYDTGFVAACKKQAQELIKIESLEPAAKAS